VEILVKDFSLDGSIVADRIYGTFPHVTTPTGVHLSGNVKEEFERFLNEYNQFLQVTAIPFYRIDAYFSEGKLHILEVNAAFVDGWGTALNLARACGVKVTPQLFAFPKQFATLEKEYLPELKLLVAELAALGLSGHRIVPYQQKVSSPLYVYGRTESGGNELVMPMDGLRLDDKRNLAAFSWIWQSEYISIPLHYTNDVEEWDNIPSSVVLKFCDKSGEESQQARTSVLIGKPDGKAKFLRSCYEAGTLLAQEFVQPTVHTLGNAQLILLTTGNALVTGYTQFSQKKIINDNSTHGPLCFE